MRLIEAPLLSFTCIHCGAKCAGGDEEFIPQNTMPPTWQAKCAFCRCTTVCSPAPLIARAVANKLGL